MSRATFGENDDLQADIEDRDTRFIQSLKTEKGADMSRKFFKNISGEYLM